MIVLPVMMTVVAAALLAAVTGTATATVGMDTTTVVRAVHRGAMTDTGPVRNEEDCMEELAVEATPEIVPTANLEAIKLREPGRDGGGHAAPVVSC